jgi:hypothetical protein
MFQTGSWLRKGRKSSLARSTAALDDEIMRPKSALRLWSDNGGAAPHFGGKGDQLIRGGNFETTGEATRASLEDYGCRKEIVKIIQTSTVQR